MYQTSNSSNNQSSSLGCCLFGFVFALFAGIFVLIKRAASALWRAAPHIVRFLYYFIAWPILLFEYAWRRGGAFRVFGVIFGIMFVIVYASINAAGNQPRVASIATATVTSTPVTIIATPTGVPISSATTLSIRTNTVQVTATAGVVQQATAIPPATDTAIAAPAATAIPQATDTAIPQPTDTAIPAPAATTVPPSNPTNPSPGQAIDPSWVEVQVSRVVDGDTVHVIYNGVDTTVRLIGVDTPETVDPRKPVQCYGVEASNYTKAQLSNQTVYLEFDASQGTTDKYKRLLAFIRRADGSLFNYDLIANGYAFEYTYQGNPYRYQSEFIAAARDARENGRGLWAASTCNGVTGSVSTSTTGDTAGQSQAGTAATAAPVLTAADEAYPCQVNQIKGNRNSMIYHVPSGASYAKTRANVECFDSEAAAITAGYRKAKR